MKNQKNKLVYSTSGGGDRRKQSSSTRAPGKSLPPQQQDLRVMRDRKGRKGKVVTVINGFVLTEADIKALTKQLKNLCGAGGTAKNEAAGQVIEIQGDHRERVAEKLKSFGYKVKLAGG